MLEAQRFTNVRLWPRGVYTDLFRPEARSLALRQSWGVEPLPEGDANALDHDSTVPESDSASKYSRASADHAAAKVVLLYVGRLSWEKNLRLLVEAARGLEHASSGAEEDGEPARPVCRLVFVGDGPSRAELESLCGAYGLDAVFMGYRKGEELAQAFASADIFAFPSWSVFSY